MNWRSLDERPTGTPVRLRVHRRDHGRETRWSVTVAVSLACGGLLHVLLGTSFLEGATFVLVALAYWRPL